VDAVSVSVSVAGFDAHGSFASVTHADQDLDPDQRTS
jgi:hypothetical protein